MRSVNISFVLAVTLLGQVAGAGPATDALRALEGLDSARIPTGILYDRALPMSALTLCDGNPGAPTVNAGHWRQMLHELSLAAGGEPDWPDAAAARRLARAVAQPGVVPLGLLDFRYARLRPDALTRGLVVREGELWVEGATAAHDSPYLTARVFAAAALTPRTHRGAEMAFVLPTSLLLGNAKTAAALEFDADDGEGWRPLFPDRPLPVRYTATGVKTLRLRATAADGASLVAFFTFEIAALVTPPPSATWPITATVPYQSVLGTGEAYVYLAPEHTEIAEPVVVVEGFDLDNTMNWDELYALLNRENLLEDLRGAGHDAIVLNFTDSTAPIQRNAMVLVELLQQVRAAQADSRDLAVIGASMGGLVARYGLAWMEDQDLAHHVRAYVSFDTPHTGANIPLGVQYWLQLFQIESSEAGYLLSRLDTPAARQMLLYHHTDPPGASGQSDPLRATFLNDLTAVGNYPAQLRKVAVANGSGAGFDQGYAAGAQLISYEYYSLLVDIIGNVWAVPDGGSRQILDGLIDRIWPLPNDDLDVTVSGTRPWDNAPGGARASLADMDATPAPYGDIVALYDDHCFVPTVSALALPTDDPFFDITGQGDPALLSPFDAVYYPTDNQEHVLVTVENKAWFLAEVPRRTSAVDPDVALAAPAALLGAWPNPFNPATQVAFDLAAPAAVRLDVFDARGAHLHALADAPFAAGRHAVVWDGRDAADRELPSGVYFCRLRASGVVQTTRLTLLR